MVLDLVHYLMVVRLLDGFSSQPWTLQGFGMLRLYLSPDVRLHVWSPDHRVPGGSSAHDHPWDFTSTVLAGRLRNVVYDARTALAANHPSPTHHSQRILCGENAEALERGPDVALRVLHNEVYGPGESYQQPGAWFHTTEAEPGTITMITRKVPPGRSPDHATVFWPLGTTWQRSAPRLATPPEVTAITSLGRAALFEEFKRRGWPWPNL